MERHNTSPTLIERMRDPADRAAWGRFESTYAELVVRYCRARGLQVADAEDAWQLTLVKLVGSIPKFKYDRARGRFRDYLFVVVRSVLANGAHRAGPTAGAAATGMVADDDSISGRSPSPGHSTQEWEREWQDFHFRRAWETVSRDFEPQSLAAFECLLGGQTVRQVADRFAMSEPGLHKVKQRVRDRLAEQIRAQVAEEDGDE